MPTNRSRQARPRVGQTTGLPDYIYHTFTRGYLLGKDEGFRDSATDEELRQLWKKHKPQIMERFMHKLRQDTHHPGDRPWPVFDYDLENERRIVAGYYEYIGPVAGDDSRPTIRVAMIESDFEFLGRFGLLYDWEIELHGDPADAPQWPPFKRYRTRIDAERGVEDADKSKA